MESKNSQIWNVNYFSTSDSEDNDTDSDEENTVDKNESYSTMKIKESV